MNTLMEKRCEFCTALYPIVYCKADAAHLCLSCDLKVHSANALSYRHPRTLVCESCRYYPALVRCFDHEMFMCQSCDTNHHVSFQHRKRVISCYVGCPSAKDLAALWGLNWSKLDNNSVVSGARNSNVSKSSRLVSEVSSSEMESMISVLYPESQGGSSSVGTKVVRDDNLQENSYLILQQILDLERLQLSQGLDDSCLVKVKERTGGLPCKPDTTWKGQKTPNTQLEQQFTGQLHIQNSGSPLEVKTDEPLSSPFSQLDNLTSAGNLLQGDSYWQCKSPLHNNEMWLQNMQDLGVCDEVKWMDDDNIPDVDLTFRNFEELFGSEHEPNRGVVDGKNTACSFADKHPTFVESSRGGASTTEEFPGPSLVRLPHQPNVANRYNYTPDREPPQQTSNNYPIRPSYSTSSFSVSRLTGESSGSEYKDDGLSPTFPKPQPLQQNSHDSDRTKLDSKGNVIMRYKEKKVLRHEKQALHRFPRSKSDVKKGARGQALKAADTSANVTRSF